MQAEEMGAALLSWLAQDDELVGRFMAQTGSGVETLREMASSPEFMAAVFDFVLSEDMYVLGAAEALGVGPEEIARARQTLPGGDVPEWT